LNLKDVNSKGVLMRKNLTEDFLRKFNKLSYQKQLVLYDFLNFMSKKKTKKRKSENLIKEKLLKVTKWSEKDIAELNSIGKGISEWTIEKF